jgi:hypothetical protein
VGGEAGGCQLLHMCKWLSVQFEAPLRDTLEMTMWVVYQLK